ncbi:MAG: hypothetical protein MUC38_07525 [Cyclobacteriaceae bacterium]|jgi:16S rRNA G966 N2-methylase RsmD|nr:hypothetical protein [Cyclobacteriaceae bacterium]
MFELLLRSEVQQYIRQHAHLDEKSWLLKNREVLGITPRLLAQQMAGLRKAMNKLPSWALAENIVYPPAINLEQTSSEATARFKASVIASSDGHERGVDLTCGWGVDSFFLSESFSSWTCVERDSDLLAMAQHNHHQLGRVNVRYENTSAEAWIAHNEKPCGWIFIDPSRRQQGNRKVVSLTDCEPDVVRMQPRLLAMATNVLIKTSPLLDIRQALRDLTCVQNVYVVAVDNECKELLFHLTPGFAGESTLHACQLSGKTFEENSRFSFLGSHEKEAVATGAQPGRFLYEPNAAILKAGAFKQVSAHWGVHKLHANTHVYTSEQVVAGFPGRVFEVLEMVKPDKSLAARLPNGQANIVLRNYPLTVAEVKKKTGVVEGGDLFLLGARHASGVALWLCRRL